MRYVIVHAPMDPETFEMWRDIYYFLTQKIGRAAFPIFCFMLVEGAIHTKNRIKYLFRLLLFSLISEPFFDLCLKEGFTFEKQNVYFTLAIGLLAIILYDLIYVRFVDKNVIFMGACIIAVLLACMGLAYVIKSDYSYKGVLLISIFYLLRMERLWSCILGYLCFLYEPFSIFGFAVLPFYNGKRKAGHKYFSYIFYPLHLGIIFIARKLVQLYIL